MIRKAWIEFAFVTALSLGTKLVVELAPLEPLRLPLVLFFITVCPGLALVRLLHLYNPYAEVALTVALSLATTTTVSLVMVYTELWSLNTGFDILIVFSVTGAILRLISAHSFSQKVTKKCL